MIKEENGEVICQQTITLSSGNIHSEEESSSRTKGSDITNSSFNTAPQKDLSKVSIFPNPATDRLFFKMSPYVGKRAKLFLFDHLGKMLSQQEVAKVTDDPVSMNTDHLQNGLYMLIIEVDSQVAFSRKVIIHRRR